MTDYNDGNWHGWNGGECPVHPKSEVEVFGIPKAGGQYHKVAKAKDIAWYCVMVFRVTKAHREPREFWIITNGEDYIYPSRESAEVDMAKGEEIIHVREVLE